MGSCCFCCCWRRGNAFGGGKRAFLGGEGGKARRVRNEENTLFCLFLIGLRGNFGGITGEEGACFDWDFDTEMFLYIFLRE